jgi:hypothetical protein
MRASRVTRSTARDEDSYMATSVSTAATGRQVVLEAHTAPRASGALKFVPGFLYILVIYLAGVFAFPDPRATLIQVGAYHLSWVEVLLLSAAFMGMAEQMRVSHPGVDNTMEAILMAAFAGLQVLLLALGAAGVKGLEIFNNTEFLMLTMISMTGAVIAILINARTLRRTIGVGDSGS